MKYIIHQASYIILGCSSKKNINRPWRLRVRFSYCLLVASLSNTTFKKLYKITIAKWTQLYHLDNRSYSTIQPLTYPTYIMKIGKWLSILKFFDTLSQKLICTADQNSHQFLKKLNANHWIGSSSPVTNPSGVLTNIYLT